jgi:uncharacterized damage-inducible protein DinB
MNLDSQTAPSAGISFADLLRYSESEALRWRSWFEAQPADVLDLPFGDTARRMGNVREMIWHIFITEWVYACVLNGEPYDRWDQFKSHSVAELFEIGERARAGLWKYLATANEAGMATELTLSGGGFTIGGSARKFLTHTFVHSLRHWAQLATVLRQNGRETSWPHDFVLTDVIA